MLSFLYKNVWLKYNPFFFHTTLVWTITLSSNKVLFYKIKLYKHNRKYYVSLKENFKYTKKVLLLEKKKGLINAKKVLFSYQSFINEKKVIKSLTAFYTFLLRKLEGFEWLI